MKAIRTLIAVPLLLAALAAFGGMVFYFGRALFTWNGTSLIFAFTLMVICVVLAFIAGLVNPKPKPTTTPKKAEEPVTDTGTQVRALIIPADPALPIKFGPIDSGLATSQALVGGFIEAVGRGLNWVAYADEDGKVKNRPYNARATHALSFIAAHNPNDPIVGDVLVMGTTSKGDAADLPNKMAGQFQEIAGEVPA